GYRIELDEVADAMMQHPGVISAAVLVKDNNHLVGYFSPENVNVQELQKTVADQLPYYMVPAVWVGLNDMPQNTGGKIDKNALQALDVIVEVTTLETEIEKTMAKIWAEVLNVDVNAIGRNTSFFTLGGDSISVVKVYARGRCVRHGGKKACAKPGCRGNVRIGDFCARHAVGGAKRQCRVAGCGRIGRVKGICVAHGGGRFCAQEQCASFARVGSYCQRHRHLKQSSTNSTLMAVGVVDEGDYDVDVIDTVLHMSAVDLTLDEFGSPTSPRNADDQEMVCFYF
ncbi:hypothetical protein As57867_022716, partial [Aphanomyces stellatus]